MEYVKKYPEDYRKPLLLLMGYLKRVNIIFFNKDETFLVRNWRFFYVVPLMGYHLIAMSVYLVGVFMQGEDVFADAFMIPLYIVTIQALLKVSVVILNKQQLENVIEELGAVWRIHHLNGTQKVVKASMEKELRVAGVAFMRLPQLVAWQYLLLPIIYTLLNNVILGNDDEKRLPFSCTYPYDPTSNWFVYGATYVYQVYCMLLIVYMYLGSDFMHITLSSHLSVEFMLLCEDLIHIKPTTVENYQVAHSVLHNGDIRGFVKSHQKLIMIARKLDAALNKMMFINLLFTTINLSFFGLAALAAMNIADRLVNFIVVVTGMIEVLILCYFCDKLKAASEAIFYAASNNLWYEGDREYKTIMRFVMFRSLKPCYLTSLKYTPITLQTFTKVLSTSWSYFSLVSTVYKDSQ